MASFLAGANVQSLLFCVRLKAPEVLFSLGKSEMAHVPKEELLRAATAGGAEVERLASHLSSCLTCRAMAFSLLKDCATPAVREVPLRSLLELAMFERDTAIERLLARAELTNLRRLTRGAQKARVIRSRACHTSAFLEEIIAVLCSPAGRDEAEFLASLAILAAQGMDHKRYPQSVKNDVLAAIWTETANIRRINGESNPAQAALLRAKQHLEAGTGAATLRARWLSILASLLTDRGERDQAMLHLEECRCIYNQLSDWPLLARTLVQMAHCLACENPERSLSLIDKASLFMAPEEAGLSWLSESIRTECLITLRRIDEALRAYDRSERLRPAHEPPRANLRSTFTAARLLEALGLAPEAEVLFDDAVSGNLDQGYYKDALLDLLYLFGFHLRLGSLDQAVDMSLRTLGTIHDASTLHDQIHSVWARLIEAARGQSLDDRVLAQARDYFRAHWRHPAPLEPVLANQKAQPSAAVRATEVADEALVAPLIARALWSRIRREVRKEQQARVSGTQACHSKCFVEVLLSGIRTAGSGDNSEFLASLALAAVQETDEPPAVRHDLSAQVWIEVANSRRVAVEWDRAHVALRRAQEHLAQGSGDPLNKAKMHSVAASLYLDQGRRTEALSLLQNCQAIYEAAKAWPLVARTMVHAAHTLVNCSPKDSLVLAEQAVPMIPPTDTVLQWLATSIRTECLIELGETWQALQAFQLAESLRRGHPRADAALRSNFTAARLLEGLGRLKEAERLFESVIGDAFEHELYREAQLDLLYLFGFHIRLGAIEKAVTLCRFTISRLDLLEVGHAQLRIVWLELMEAAQRQTISQESLTEVRDFLRVHWKYPAIKAPRFAFKGHRSGT